MMTWKDPWIVVVIDTDGHTLEALKFRPGVRSNNLEINNLGRVSDTMLIYVPVGQ
jgi:hypothetical protein